jgi:adenosylcobinamide-phosphate guanylyltransferase
MPNGNGAERMITQPQAHKQTSAGHSLRIPALVMAGGRGKRIGLPVEKPMLPLLGRPMIDWVADAVASAKLVTEFYVVTSENTLETEKHSLSRGLRIIRTDAKGYHDDLKQALAKAKIGSAVLTVSSDLPALTGAFVDRVVASYQANGKDALTVLVPVEKRLKLGLSISSTYPFQGKKYAVCGVNVIDAMKTGQEKLDECAFISEEMEAVLNVNTIQDLVVAENFLAKEKMN